MFFITIKLMVLLVVVLLICFRWFVLLGWLIVNSLTCYFGVTDLGLCIEV